LVLHQRLAAVAAAELEQQLLAAVVEAPQVVVAQKLVLLLQ
jgi:hypothetical protein